MCLITLAWQHHAHYPLVVAANRDEFHKRPTAAADWWADAPDVLAGRDLEQGGTWLGLSRTGKFAGITNARGTVAPDSGAPSRGWLLRDYLCGTVSAANFADQVAKDLCRYAGLNLFLADRTRLFYLSNVTRPALRELPPGRYVLSNGHLDSDWPKMQRAAAALDRVLTGDRIESESLLALLGDRRPALDAELPDTGVGPDMEKLLSPIFITSPVYGTRCSTSITADLAGEVSFTERRFDPSGTAVGDAQYRFHWTSAVDAGS